MNQLYRLLLILATTFIVYYFINHDLEQNVLSTMYNVSGVMFSIGMGLIVTMGFGKIKNKDYLAQLRKRINQVRNIYIIYFVLTTVTYIVSFWIGEKNILQLTLFNFSLSINFTLLGQSTSLCCSIYSIIYFISNFIKIQKLKDDINDI